MRFEFYYTAELDVVSHEVQRVWLYEDGVLFYLLFYAQSALSCF